MRFLSISAICGFVVSVGAHSGHQYGASEGVASEYLDDDGFEEDYYPDASLYDDSTPARVSKKSIPAWSAAPSKKSLTDADMQQIALLVSKMNKYHRRRHHSHHRGSSVSSSGSYSSTGSHSHSSHSSKTRHVKKKSSGRAKVEVIIMDKAEAPHVHPQPTHCFPYCVYPAVTTAAPAPVKSYADWYNKFYGQQAAQDHSHQHQQAQQPCTHCQQAAPAAPVVPAAPMSTSSGTYSASSSKSPALVKLNVVNIHQRSKSRSAVSSNAPSSMSKSSGQHLHSAQI